MGFWDRLKNRGKGNLNNPYVSTLTAAQSLAFDFEDASERTLEKMVNKIDKASDKTFDCDKPEDTLKWHNEAVRLVEEMKEFCYAKGAGGKYYYDTQQADYEQMMRNNLKDYIDHNYQEDMKAYQENLEYKKKIKQITSKILKLVHTSNIFLQKDLKSQFEEADKGLVTKCLNDLIKDGKVRKEKQGSTNRLTLS